MDNVFSKPAIATPLPQRTNTIADQVHDGAKVMEVDKNISPVLYEARFGKPYSMDALGVGTQYIKTSPGSMEALKDIDSFILGQMSKNSIASTKEGYKEMLTKLYETLGLNENTTPSVKIQKLAGLIRTKGIKSVKM